MKNQNNTPFKMAGFGRKLESQDNAHNEHAARTNEYKEITDHHGSINPAPNKITQFFRNFKANPFVQDIAKVAAITAPIGLISKAKAVKNVGSAFGNAAKQYLGKGTKNVPVVGKPGTTVKVPKTSSTQQVSYANPRISMTKAEREAAGY